MRDTRNMTASDCHIVVTLQAVNRPGQSSDSIPLSYSTTANTLFNEERSRGEEEREVRRGEEKGRREGGKGGKMVNEI